MTQLLIEPFARQTITDKDEVFEEPIFAFIPRKRVSKSRRNVIVRSTRFSEDSENSENSEDSNDDNKLLSEDEESSTQDDSNGDINNETTHTRFLTYRVLRNYQNEIELRGV